MPFAAMLCAISTAGCETQPRMENPEAVGTGCRQFGRDVLSDTSVVKMIQENFVPLLIHNNTPGKDAEILARFDEPACVNYQVVRFLDANGRDLIPRKDRVREAPELKQRMALVLKMKPTDTEGQGRRITLPPLRDWTNPPPLGISGRAFS